MRRYLVLAAAAATAAALAVPALAAPSKVNVPAKFGKKLTAVRMTSEIDLRLPSRLEAPVRASRVHGAIESLGRGRYHLSLGVGRNCHEATACYIASFFGRKGGKLRLPRKVQLATGINGRFAPISCGASCAPAQIQWREDRVRYEIDYKGSKRELKALANSAIRAGDR